MKMNSKQTIVLLSIMAIFKQSLQAIAEETPIVNYILENNQTSEHYSENLSKNLTVGKASNNSRQHDENHNNLSHNFINSDYNKIKHPSSGYIYKSNIYPVKDVGNVYESSSHPLGKENNLNFTSQEEIISYIGTFNLSLADFIKKYDNSDSRDYLEDYGKGNETIFDWKRREDTYKITTPEQFPYSVLLMTLKNKNASGYCTGSLLTDEWVLTASHCLVGVDQVFVYAGGNSGEELLGVIEKKIALPKTAQILLSKLLIIHPFYLNNDNDCDVGLIQLIGKFKMTKAVNTIKLATKPWTYHSYTSCSVTGFGKVLFYEKREDDLHRKTHVLDVKKPCLCSFRLQTMFGTNVTSRYICTRPKKDYGMCRGDSGGGLVCEGEIRGVAMQLVNLKDTELCDESYLAPLQCGGVNILSIFMDTCPFLPWINKHVKLFNSSEISTKCKYTGGGERSGISLIVVFIVISLQHFQ